MNTEELKRLAEAVLKAYSGLSWQVTMARNEHGVTHYHIRSHSEPGIAVIKDQYWEDDHIPPVDHYGYIQPDDRMDCDVFRVDIARLIAAANPAAILAMIAEIDSLRDQVNGLTGELGRVRDMAESVGTIGGPQALKDSLAALGPVLAGVSTTTDESRAKLEALVAVLGKGLKPQQAQAVAGAALSAVRSRAMDIERVTGRRVLDDRGNLLDPGKALADLKRLADKRFGSNEEAKRRALMADFGQDLGLAIMRTDFGAVDKLASSSKDKGKTSAEAATFRDSKEGKRIASTLAKDQVQRSVAEKALGIHDTLVDNLGAGGALGVELGAGHLIKPVLAGAGKVVAGAGNALASGGGTVGAAGLAGVGLMSGAFVGAAAMQGKVLTEIGEDRDVMGARYRNEHADIVAQGLANRAVREGDIGGAYKATGGDAATATKPGVDREARQPIARRSVMKLKSLL